jgi:hypothetical protein
MRWLIPLLLILGCAHDEDNLVADTNPIFNEIEATSERGSGPQEAYRALSDCAAAIMRRNRSPSASEVTLTGSDLA